MYRRRVLGVLKEDPCPADAISPTFKDVPSFGQTKACNAVSSPLANVQGCAGSPCTSRKMSGHQRCKSDGHSPRKERKQQRRMLHELHRCMAQSGLVAFSFSASALQRRMDSLAKLDEVSKFKSRRGGIAPSSDTSPLSAARLQRDFRVRKKDKNVALQHIEDLHGKFQDIQMLKFGQIVDLDLIERSAPNKYVQELQEKVLQAEAEHRRRIAEWQKRMEKQKKELTKITCDNTSLMEQIVSMGYSQMQLDAALNARIANVTVNDNEPLNELREIERDRCKDLLSLQSKEIATLKAEINLFRKKGGHIYTTVTANRQ